MATYATFNPSDKSAGITLSNGNLTASHSAGWQAVRATMGKSTGKWYFEITQVGTYAGGENMAGVATSASPLDVLGGDQYGWVYETNGKKRHDNYSQNFGDSMADGDVYCFAIDLDNGKMWAGKNGTWVGDPEAGTGEMYADSFGTVFPGVGGAHTEVGFTANFGASAFAYTVPTGFNSGWYESGTKVDYAITDNDDNGVWDDRASGSFYSTSALWLADFMGADYQDAGFFRFLSVAVPQGATILAATFTITGMSGSADTVNFNVYANLENDASAPLDQDEGYALSRTTAHVPWSSVPHFSDSVEYSPADIKDVIQEIVDQAGWESGNALMILLTTPASSDNSAWRRAYTYTEGKPAELSITWEAGGPPPVEADTDEDFTLDDTASWEYTPAPNDIISEEFSLSDAFTAEYMGESTSEDFSLSDSVNGYVPKESTSENITFADNLSAPGSTYSTQLSEAMSFSDTITGGSDIPGPMSESLSLSDVMTGLLLADSLSDSFSMSDYMEADELIWIKNTFPNLSGKHLTLKFAPSGSALYFMRMKLFKSDDRVDFDARHPNLSGHHLTLKVSHSANEDFTLAYASMGLFGKIE